MTGDSGRAVCLEQACSYLRGADPVLARLIDARPDFDPRAWLARLPPMDRLGALLFQVIGQQLSVAATRRTLARIGALFDGHIPAPAGLLAVDPAKLREAALSWRKIGTLRDVAERLSGGRLDQAALSELLTIAGQVVAGTSFDPDRRMLLAGCPRGRPMGGRIPVYRRVGDVIRMRPGKADRGIRTSCLRMPSRTLPPATAQVDDLCAYPPRLPQLHHPRVIDLAPSPGDGVAVLPARARLLCRAACTSGLAVDHQCRPDPPRSPTQGAGSAASGCAG